MLPIGLGGALSLVIWAETDSALHLWTQVWFDALITVGAIFALIGFYSLAAPIRGWWWPQTKQTEDVRGVTFNITGNPTIHLGGDKDNPATQPALLQPTPPTEPSLTTPDKQQFLREVIHLREFALEDDLWIRDKTFEGCQIIGPTIIAPMRTQFIKCGWGGTSKALVWATPDDLVIGAIGVERCVFRNCEFKFVALAVPPSEVEQIRSALGGNGSKPESGSSKPQSSPGQLRVRKALGGD
jgi:hypothetical protein